jgi:hypothetical protein
MEDDTEDIIQIQLNAEDSLRFAEALLNPPAPTPQPRPRLAKGRRDIPPRDRRGIGAASRS